jgi:hypothetical protein
MLHLCQMKTISGTNKCDVLSDHSRKHEPEYGVEDKMKSKALHEYGRSRPCSYVDARHIPRLLERLRLQSSWLADVDLEPLRLIANGCEIVPTFALSELQKNEG